MTIQTPTPLTVTLQCDAEGQFFEIPPEFEFAGEQVWISKTASGLVLATEIEPSETSNLAMPPRNT